MDLADIKEFIADNGVPAFHGIDTLDAFKYLSEMESLPEFVRKDYAGQYEKHVYEIGYSEYWNLGKQLYTHFGGDGDVKILRTMDCVHYSNVTIKALEIEIPYFTKMNEYLDTNRHIIGIGKRPAAIRSVLDIVIDDVSLFDILLKKDIGNNKSACVDMFYLVNNRDYAIINGFSKPYNGVCSSRIPEIFRDIQKDRNSTQGPVSYITGLVNDLCYFTGVRAKYVESKDYRNVGTLTLIKD